MQHIKPLLPLSIEKQNLRKSEKCHICNYVFETTDTKVKDHDHLRGRYRGRAHSSCNWNYKVTKCIPIAFHNSTGYDGHLFIKELRGEKNQGVIHFSF